MLIDFISCCLKIFIVKMYHRVWDQYRKKASFSSTVGLSPSASPNRQGRQSNPDQRTVPRKTPTEAILKRLTTYESPQPPPPIPPMSPLHLPHIHDSTLIDQDALLYLVQRYTGEWSIEHVCDCLLEISTQTASIRHWKWVNMFKVDKIVNANLRYTRVRIPR